MKTCAWLVSTFALVLMQHEWLQLRDQLARAYKSLLSDSSGRPSILVQRLLISGEDHRFFGHGGIDLIAVARALWRRIMRGRREGASTIEMQIVRVLSGRYERTLRRKIREMALATLVTKEIPKHELPMIYLQIAYFGWRMNGFPAACRRIGCHPDCMTLSEAACLVASLKYPQPREISARRRRQIDTRTQHLLKLYSRHRLDQTYAGLYWGLSDTSAQSTDTFAR